MASEPANDISLADCLAPKLPLNTSFSLYHISTPPTRCAPLYSPPPGAKPERTYCESHLLNVAIHPSGLPKELFVLAIEILIFSTQNLTTLFVSKADSTGYLSLLQLCREHASPLRTITTEFVSYLIRNRQRKDRRLVLSLFARASDQYLYPGSVENKHKHVSTDRELVRWWCRVTNPILQDYTSQPSVQDLVDNHSKYDDVTTAHGYLIVPGEDSHLSFLPPDVRSDPRRRLRWSHGHPLQEISSFPNAPPRCLVPHFPDDPKARFLDDLDAELPDVPNGQLQDSPSKRGSGIWKSVRSLEQFWESMAFRQECSSGRLVGFLWIVFTPPAVTEPGTETTESQVSSSSLSVTSQFQQLPVPDLRPRSKSPKRKRTQRLTGPIKPRLPRIKKELLNSPTTAQPEQTSHYIWPASSRGSAVLTEKEYKRATELLLRLDFANTELASQSTSRWTDEIAVLGGLRKNWGQKIVGRSRPIPPATSNGLQHSNVIQPKRKGEHTVQDVRQAVGSNVNVLTATSVRKKLKLDGNPTTPDSCQASVSAGANLLATNLVRKKPKTS